MLQTNSKLTRRLMLGLIAVVLTMTVLSGCGKKDGSKETGSVVATYKDGGKVTRGEFDKYVGATKFFYPMYAQYEADPAFQEHMMNQLIAFRLLSNKADDATKKDADTKTTEQMKQITDYFNQQGKDALTTQLKEYAITQDDLKDYVKMSMVVLGSAEKQVTDDQVKTNYDEKLAAKALDVVTVRHVLVMLQDESGKDLRTKDEALKRANEVKDKLKAGGDFAALAKEYSDDGGSKDNGGQYADADPNQWVENFKNAALTLPLNQISEPIETEYGYHVMKVESRKTKTLDETKADIKSELAETVITNFMDKDLPTYDIKITGLATATPTPAASVAPSATPAATATPTATGTPASTPTPAK
ncbi:peptidylprolyl isomerase [Paenibacillus sp. HJGM_3]|uniref:peptidylprolyl isomerase n=1 Tax=Paenibacillus sp. HJGM_3 TaxID=3379816 RepID=UPI00385ED1B1